MNIVKDDDRDPRDDELHAALRLVYHTPSEDSYWAFLERRIMARITAEGAREWWSYFPAWQSRLVDSDPFFRLPMTSLSAGERKKKSACCSRSPWK